MNKPAAKPLNDCKNSQRFSYLNKFSTQHAKMELFESVIRKTHQTKRCLQNQQQNRLVLLYEAECFCKKFDNEYSLVQYKLDVVIKNTYFSKLQNRIHKNLNSNSRSRINPEADVELQFYPQLYLMSNNLVVKVAIGALSFAALAFGTLFWINKKLQSQTQPLTKQQVIELLKLIRRHKYGIYKQITTFVLNISREMRGNINNQMIQQFLDGPESPLKIRDEFQKIQENVCLEQKTTVEAFNAGVQTFKADQQVLTLLKQQDQDLQISMAGKLPTFELQIPEFFTKESFIKTQNLITKKTYLHQVAVFKKIAEYTQEELEQNPAILGEFGNHEQELQFILQEQKLGTKYDPPFAVYNAATLKYLNDATTRNQLAKIEEGYQRILKKYTMKLQNKTIRPQELDQMEDQIMYFDPLA